MNVEKLVYMANQIGNFFRAQGEAAAVDGIADHLLKFWEPRMRAAIYAHLAQGGDGLQPLVLRGVAAAKALDDARPA